MHEDAAKIWCPKCHQRFPVALISLLTSKTVNCAHCGACIRHTMEEKPLPPGILDLREPGERSDGTTTD